MNDRKEKQIHKEEKSRTEYSAQNTTIAMLARIVAILLGFGTRVVFTHTLSEDYVGINGLFTDILNVLALSELGVGTAITYALYRPIAEKNIEKQKSLMQMYKQFYRIVAGIVLGAGLLIIPFMDVLIKNQPRVDYLILIYLMYLANSVVSYLLIYKRTLIDAHQLSYIGVLYQTVFLVIQNIIQIAVLLITRNFILFLSILIGCTLLNNLCISRKADELYPFLKDKKIQPLNKKEKQGIYKNIRAMLMHKIGNVVVNNTDNLLLSSMVGIVSVGMYSNYFLVIGSVRQVLNQAFQGITASVGNLGVEESKDRVKRIFEAAFFIGQWMFGFAAICLFELLTPFVELSFGSGYVFSRDITLVLCLNFYFTGMRQATLVFRDSLGLFWYDRHKSLVEALINLVVSIVLGYYFGTIGIFLGTLCSTVTTSLWVEPYMLYKHRLEAPVYKYFVKYAIYFLVTCAVWWITDGLCGLVTGSLIRRIVLRLLICTAIVNALFLLVYVRSREFVFLFKKLKRMLSGRLSNVTGQENTNAFKNEEEALFSLIRRSLLCRKMPEEEPLTLTEKEWETVADMAGRQGVLPILYEELCKKQKDVPQQVIKKASDVASQTVMQQYRLLFLSKYLTELLGENSIPVVVLKGVSVGAYYPVPELRKSGDVDLLLLNPAQITAAKELLKKEGLIIKEEQPALHHIVMATKEGIDIELHTMLAEPFDNEKTNAFLREILKEADGPVTYRNVMGVELPVLSGAYYGFELLLHMLQHFLRSGFGLRLLCDWVVFWQKVPSEAEKRKYLELVEKTGIKGFSDIITQVCVLFLGVDEALVEWMDYSDEYSVEEFMRETLDAEEFGKSDKSRMVVMRGTGVFDYIREFHHQMHLNFPRAGRCFIAWPVLWGITLVRFVRNNRKLRKTSTGDILREATRRSRLMKEIRLFK